MPCISVVEINFTLMPIPQSGWLQAGWYFTEITNAAELQYDVVISVPESETAMLCLAYNLCMALYDLGRTWITWGTRRLWLPGWQGEGMGQRNVWLLMFLSSFEQWLTFKSSSNHSNSFVCVEMCLTFQYIIMFLCVQGAAGILGPPGPRGKPGPMVR